ncbi:hypothetical protein GGX14DRAFT_407176 [Mycena pura]|uniref:TEA domain-containing protein n=1 Tax=Mycena pura TaxID=153505 RepID=A0AAD6URM4_9AGAR|nr:hypothetical protein GGX14DRAFT_407176 [Mycena pura]
MPLPDQPGGCLWIRFLCTHARLLNRAQICAIKARGSGFVYPYKASGAPLALAFSGTPHRAAKAMYPHRAAQAMYWSARADTPESAISSAESSAPASPQTRIKNLNANERNAWRALQSDATGDVLRSVLRVRKTWKTARSGETVWPLELEAALIEGLEQYIPEDSRETRILGRFPRRNRFISEYILAKTGQRRTQKQVGSRLQQLRESCGGQRLCQLLSPFREPPESPASPADSTPNSPSTPPPPPRLVAAPAHTLVYIDILPDSQWCPDAAPTANGQWPDADTDADAGYAVLRVSDHPRRLAQINPIVCFTARAPICAHARFTVSAAGLILHAESVPLWLELLADEPQLHAGFVYSTWLVPRYWQVILDSPDPTRFTIIQEVVKDDSAASVLFAATYKFKFGFSSPAFSHPSPASSSLGLYKFDVDSTFPLGSYGDGMDEAMPVWGSLASDVRGGTHGQCQRPALPGDSLSLCLWGPADIPVPLGTDASGYVRPASHTRDEAPRVS